MPQYNMVAEALQLGGVLSSTVDLATGELLPYDECITSVIGGEGLHGGGCPSGGAPWGGVPANVPGLSKAHKSTVEKQASVMAWTKGTLVKAQRTGPYTMKQVGGGKRGKVKSFSRGSRRRFQYMLGKVDREGLPLFVTLTYPDNFPDDLQTWALHLERFRERVRRRGWGAIWRREFKERKSGENVGKIAPHYHLLVWGADYCELLSWISHTWYDVCGRICPEHLAAGTKVEKLRSWRGVRSYVSKYMAKLEDLPQLASTGSVGRFWGVINRDAIPWVECDVMTMTDKQVNTFFRYMRRYAHLPARSTPTMTLLCNDPSQWLHAAMIC